MEGIKEIKEVQIAANELVLKIVSLVKDGVDIKDGLDIAMFVMLDADFKAKLNAAIEGINQVPAELKDIQMPEMFELMQEEILFIPKLVAALK